MKFLAIYETPCVGTTHEAFEAETKNEADNHAWETSLGQYYVSGSYDLYQIIWTGCTHKLVPVTPEDLEDELEEVEDNDHS